MAPSLLPITNEDRVSSSVQPEGFPFVQKARDGDWVFFVERAVGVWIIKAVGITGQREIGMVGAARDDDGAPHANEVAEHVSAFLRNRPVPPGGP